MCRTLAQQMFAFVKVSPHICAMLRCYTISVVMLWCLHLNIIANCVMTDCASSAMCLSPISIPNINYGAGNVGMNFLKDTKSSRIYVPCGHCSECIAIKQASIAQRAQMEEIGCYAFAAMLSYNDASLPTVLASDGKRFKYADFRDFKNCIKHIRQKKALSRPFRYYAVSEFGGDETRSGRKPTHRPHFHAIFFLPKYPGDDVSFTPVQLQRELYVVLLRYWRRNYGSDKYPLYKPLCTPRSSWRDGKLHRNFDVTYCDCRQAKYAEGVGGASIYMSKYMIKESSYVYRLQKAIKLNYTPEEASFLWSKVHPRSACSRGFGVTKSVTQGSAITPSDEVAAYVRKCIDLSAAAGEPSPRFYNRLSGKTMPMSQVYIDRFLTPDDRLAFLVNRDPDATDGTYVSDVPSDNGRTDRVRKLSRDDRIRKMSASRPDALDVFDDAPLDAPFGSMMPDMPDFVDPSADFVGAASDFDDNDLPDFEAVEEYRQYLRDVISCDNQPSIAQPIIKRIK